MSEHLITPTGLWSENTEGAFRIAPSTYFAAPGVSNSMLKRLRPTPAHLVAYLKEPRDPSPEMILGTLTHTLILTPDETLPNLAIKPRDMKFTTIEGKAWRAEAEAANKTIISSADYDALHGMTKSVSLHPFAQEALGEGSLPEVSIFCRTGGEGRTIRKARMDVVPSGNCLADVKTTGDASPAAFAKAMIEFGYACQAAHYLDLWNRLFPEDTRNEFVFWVVEKTPPYLCACYFIGADSLAWAREVNAARLATYDGCVETGRWPGYPEGPQQIEIPKWAFKADVFAE